MDITIQLSSFTMTTLTSHPLFSHAPVSTTHTTQTLFSSGNPPGNIRNVSAKQAMAPPSSIYFSGPSHTVPAVSSFMTSTNEAPTLVTAPTFQGGTFTASSYPPALGATTFPVPTPFHPTIQTQYTTISPSATLGSTPIAPRFLPNATTTETYPGLNIPSVPAHASQYYGQRDPFNSPIEFQPAPRPRTKKFVIKRHTPGCCGACNPHGRFDKSSGLCGCLNCNGCCDRERMTYKRRGISDPSIEAPRKIEKAVC